MNTAEFVSWVWTKYSVACKKVFQNSSSCVFTRAAERRHFWTGEHQKVSGWKAFSTCSKHIREQWKIWPDHDQLGFRYQNPIGPKETLFLEPARQGEQEHQWQNIIVHLPYTHEETSLHICLAWLNLVWWVVMSFTMFLLQYFSSGKSSGGK